MQEYLERHVAVRRVGDYYKWDGATGGYTRKVMSNGVNYPISQDVPVISVMAAMSVTNLDLNMIYPPIGPYHGNLIRTFDPRVLADREAARKVFSPKGGCDFTLKIFQGGLERFFLLPASAVEENNPQKLRNLMTAAVNLMAAAGALSAVELLYTPRADISCLPANALVLALWPNAKPLSR